jgi:hypothetical protein
LILLILAPRMSRRERRASGYFHIVERRRWVHWRRKDQHGGRRRSSVLT